MCPGDIETMVAGPLTVVQMLPDLNEGGVEQGTLEIGKALSLAGHRSLVISRGGRLVDRLEEEGSRHIAMPFIGEKTPRCLFHLWSLRRLLANSGVDILHLRSRLPAWVGYLAWKSLPPKRRPRLVSTFHGFYSINAYSAIMARGERVIAVSQVIADHIRESYRVSRDRIAVIHRGVDPDIFNPERISSQRIQYLRRAWGLEHCGSSIVLIPARITRLKGHDLLINALAGLSDQDWVLVCAGDYEAESSHFQQLKQQCDALNLNSRVRFVGHCSDMPAAMRLADVVVSASTKPESFGRTIIEAQALERAVVAPAHGGCLETVDHGHTGWLFKPNDAASLTVAMEKSLSEASLTERMGKRGRQRVVNRFTLAGMCHRTIELYRDLALSGPSAQ